MKNTKTIKIKDIETQHPQVITPEARLIEAARMMKILDVGCLPVCEGDHLVGFLTDRDITLRAVAEGLHPAQARVRDVMTSKVVSCYEDQDIDECADLMERKQIRRIPVMDHEEHLVGIVSLSDLSNRSDKKDLAGEVLNRVSAQNLPASPS